MIAEFKTEIEVFNSTDEINIKKSEKLINNLSFTPIIELVNLPNQQARNFYENAAIQNSWSVRKLKRAVNSMLYETTGLSKNKEEVIKKQNELELLPDDLFIYAYILEFLGLKKKHNILKIN